MITFFRRVMTSWVMIGLLALIAVAFVITGVGDPFGGGNVAPGAMSKVGGKSITEGEFLTQFDRFMKKARADNPGITNAVAVKEGAVEALVGQLEGRAAIESFASEQGLSISDRAVDGDIASIPAFQVNGKFDQAAYQRALQSQSISEKDLRGEIRGAKLTQQLLAPVTIPSNAPRLLATPYASLLLEARRGSIAVIPSARFAAGLAPTDAQLTAYYRATISRYTIPERRSLRYALISKAAIAAATQVSDADIATYYGEHQDVYGGIAQRTLSQVVAPDQAIATKIAVRTKAGESFAKAAAELAGYGAGDLLLGTLSQEKFATATSAAIAQAAFALPVGGLTAPIKSDFGWHVVRVDAVIPTKSRPLAAVRGEISALLRTSWLNRLRISKMRLPRARALPTWQNPTDCRSRRPRL
jgi:peptidyl-prolyl cis-trans isomerase D